MINQYFPKIIKSIFFLLAILFSHNGYSQIENQLSVEINIGRFAKNIGIFESYKYSNEISYLNGLEIGYKIKPEQSYFFGVRKLNSKAGYGGGYSGEISNKRGVELDIGWEFLPNIEKRLNLSYSIELFGEFSKHSGTYWVDYPPDYQINHYKRYFGIAPELKFNYKIFEKLKVVLSVRLKYGHVTSTGIESTSLINVLFHNRKYMMFSFEPINSLAFKIDL
ncbi:MAG: hypothetical protein GXO79_00010 [Chlorobi bacterium]|nr:hypothetical protein [Chlorobiota bacterium]